MNLQKKILDCYLSFYPRYTLKQVSIETGIKLTRIFRLLKGAEMKISEYEIFRKIIAEKLGLQRPLDELLFESSQKLSKSYMLEVEANLSRQLFLWEVMNQSNLIQNEELKGV